MRTHPGAEQRGVSAHLYRAGVRQIAAASAQLSAIAVCRPAGLRLYHDLWLARTAWPQELVLYVQGAQYAMATSLFFFPVSSDPRRRMMDQRLASGSPGSLSETGGHGGQLSLSCRLFQVGFPRNPVHDPLSSAFPNSVLPTNGREWIVQGGSCELCWWLDAVTVGWMNACKPINP
jgi:hypothetical protein